MGGLFGLLSVGMSAISAQNAGAGTVARNTTNVNTEGYTRETVEFSATIGAPFSAGVRTGGLMRSGDLILAQRERAQSGLWARADDLTTALASLESNLAPASGGLVDDVSNFFGSLVELSSSPMDPALRNQVVARGQRLATAFNTAAIDIGNARTTADDRIRGLSQTATDLAKRIADLNHAMATETDPALADQRELAAKKLAELVGGSAHFGKGDEMRFVLSNGAVLVDGDHAARLEVTPSAARGGHLSVEVVSGNSRRDVTDDLRLGRIGAQLSFRDETALEAEQAIDQLAYDLVTNVNTIHRANVGLDGGTGRDFFTAPTQVDGASRVMSVDAALRDDHQLLATAGAGLGTTDTSGLDSLIALRDALAAGGGARTFVSEAIRTIGAVGAAHASAKSDLDVEQARSDFLASLRNSISGVDPEEELMRLAEFQHAAQAATRFVATINEMMEDLIRRI
ncbi:flagellar hook-associated protein FlgK [Myxococcota bacterium]|nr:flagellar hook-associated protein FlgK [Myxococcota bacterium]